MGNGHLALILHAHLPFVRHPEHEHFLEEDWLFEAITETYIPLLQMTERLVNDNVHSPATSAKRVAAMTMGEDAAPGGRYFSNGKVVRSSDASYDEGKARELWVSSAAITGLPV